MRSRWDARGSHSVCPTGQTRSTSKIRLFDFGDRGPAQPSMLDPQKLLGGKQQHSVGASILIPYSGIKWFLNDRAAFAKHA